MNSTRLIVLLLGIVEVLGGCVHTPPHGVERGVVSVRNDRLWDEPELAFNTGTLTGVAIDDHVILTAAHALMFEPQPDHPLRINGVPIAYEIIVDGWEGKRSEFPPKSKQVPGIEFPQSDYLLLRTTEQFESNPDLIPMRFDQLSKIRSITLVTRKKQSQAIESIPLRSLSVDANGTIGYTTFRKNARFDPEEYYLSGSPLIGEYPDGSLALVGIANSRGQLHIEYSRNRWELKEDQMLFTPAWVIPIELVEH